MNKNGGRGKKNCWEAKKCGREVGGKKTRDLGVCPAYLDKRLDGVHDGKNGGRACWVIAGTFCGGEVQGTFAQKFRQCEQCEFYQSVKREEGLGGFTTAPALLKKLRNGESKPG